MIVGPVNGFVPRPYQEWCINGGAPDLGIGIMPAFARYRRVLAVLFTGGGKTEVALSVIRRYLDSPKTAPSKRAMFLSHRDELVLQPMDRAPRFGMRFGREQGKDTGIGRPERVISTTVQTMRHRMKKYRPDEIGLIVCDEAHHGVSDLHRSVLDYFSDAYILGISATPDRLDGVGLGEVFEAYAFNYQIDTGIADGWLVPVVAHRQVIEGLDLNKLRARAGDLEPGALGELMSEYAHPVAQHLVNLTEGRPTIAFCATVAHAHAQAAALRRYTDERIEVIDGETDKDVRKRIMADFKSGALRWLINCEIATEGVDAPMTACVAMIRPTKSRALYSQCIGRGTRPEPGIVDQPHLRDDPDGRRAAIAASRKPNLLVLDFSGVCERHDLVGPEDVLAGRLSPEDRLLLGKIELIKERDAQQAEILAARKAAAAKAARLAALAAVEISSYAVDPFNPAKVLSLKDMPRNDPGAPRCSEKMAAYLTKQGIAAADKLSVEQAKKIQGALGIRVKKGLCSYRQALALQKAGVPPSTTTRISYQTAGNLMTDLTNNGWRRPRHWDADPRLGGTAPQRPMVVPPIG